MAPALTWAVGVNSTPLGLSRNSWPLAFTAPWMTETSAPRTRFSATAVLEGCTKFTVAPWPTEKVCQSTARRELDWLTVRVLPDWLRLPVPAATRPPVGRVCAWAPPAAKVASRARPAAATADRALPRPQAVSATACQAPMALFHTTRYVRFILVLAGKLRRPGSGPRCDRARV